jgi:hypothetical protein
VIQKLFQKIKHADYQVPSHVSLPAKDLLKKIFQPDIAQRIKFD